jgi:hypothetical protein
MRLGCIRQPRICAIVAHILALNHARGIHEGARSYARYLILRRRFANFSIILIVICPIGLNGQAALNENIGHS